MRIHQSWLGAILGVVYLVAATYTVHHELRHTGGGWINLRGMGVTLVTAPSQITLGLLLERLRVPRVNYARPGFGGYAQLILHVLLSTIIVYLLGFGIEWLVRRFVLAR